MVSLVVIVIVFGGILIVKFRGIRKIAGIAYIGILGVVLVLYIIPLITNTFQIFEMGNFVVNQKYIEIFAYTDLDVWADRMWRLPENQIDIIFGSGNYPSFSDVGFIRVIYMIGIIGFILIILIYGYMWLVAFKFWKLSKRTNGNNLMSADNSLHILSSALCLLIIGLFIFNLKNLYFLTRSFHELLVILFFAALREFKYLKHGV